MPLSETACNGKIYRTFGQIFDCADFARDISVEKSVVEAGEESWGEAIQGEEGV